MKISVPPTVAFICCVFLAIGCVADASLATTPVAPATQVRPANALAPNLTPALPPKPVAPAAGTYFGQVNSIDGPGGTITFTPLCLGADRKTLRELAANDKAPRIIPLLSTTEITVFVAPPNNPAAGRTVTVDLLQLVDIARATPASRYFLVVEPQGVKALEQDSGVRPSVLTDDPCPHF